MADGTKTRRTRVVYRQAKSNFAALLSPSAPAATASALPISGSNAR